MDNIFIRNRCFTFLFLCVFQKKPETIYLVKLYKFKKNSIDSGCDANFSKPITKTQLLSLIIFIKINGFFIEKNQLHIKLTQGNLLYLSFFNNFYLY